MSTKGNCMYCCRLAELRELHGIPCCRACNDRFRRAGDRVRARREREAARKLGKGGAS